MDWWASVAPLITPSGITAGGAFTIFFFLLSRGIIVTKRQHDDSITQLTEKHNEVVQTMTTGHAELLAEKQRSLDRAEKDRDVYRDSYETQRESFSELSGKVVKEIVPLLGLNVAFLKSLPTSQDGEQDER